MEADCLALWALVILLALQPLVGLLVVAEGPKGLGAPGPAALPVAAPNAQNVELVGQIGGACYAVAVQGNMAYVGLGPRLAVLDVSSPTSPTLLGQSAVLPGVVEGVVVAGSQAYVAAGSAGLRIVDVSSPASPRELGDYDTADCATGVALAGTLAYVADREGGLRILDISNPASPREVGFYITPGYALGLALAGSLVYVADYHGGLCILRYRPSAFVFLPLLLKPR